MSCTSKYLLAQQIIQGRVRSGETGSPLENVTIKLSTNKLAQLSGRDGDFSITYRSGLDSVFFSYIGFLDTAVTIESLRKYPIVDLKVATKSIEEVIVNTGYQQVKSNEITGAVDVLTNKLLNEQTGVNILDRLNNMVSAVRFDNKPINNTDLQKTNISVRGLSTINGTLDPLIVLDGFIYEGDISNIDPNNIENISLLKDAAAASIWGARAGNGVIVITSKKADFGEMTAPNISFNSTIIAQRKTDLSQLYEVSNEEYIAIEQMLFNRGYYNTRLNFTPYAAVTPAVDIFDRTKRGLLSQTDSANLINNLLNQNGRNNYADHFLSAPLTQQYSLGIRGNSRRHSYGLSVGYTGTSTDLDDKGRKTNVQLTNSYRASEKLQLDLNVLYTNQKNVTGKPSYQSLLSGGKATPYKQFFDESGSAVRMETEYRSLFLSDFYVNDYMDWNYYPATDYLHSGTTTNINELFATMNLRYKVFSFLDFNAGLQLQQQASEQQRLDRAESYLARRNINMFMQTDPNTGENIFPVPIGGILGTSNQKGQSYTFRGQFNLNKSFASHSFVGMLGAEARENVTDQYTFSAYGYNDHPLGTVPVDYANRYVVAPTGNSAIISGAPVFTVLNNRFVSFYANMNYSFQKKYSLYGSIRNDGANIFGMTTNDRWTPLWSMGGSWSLDKENFWNQSWMQVARLRATYGYSGNVDLRKTPEPIASVGGSMYTNLPALLVTELNDPSLRWEKVSTLNLAADFSVFNGRIKGSVDYYIKNGRDLYGLTEYDYTSWGVSNTITKNVASMQGRGWDITLNTVNLDKRLKWTSRAVISFNKNKTVDYYNELNNGLISFLGAGNFITPIPGRPLNAIAAFRWMGLNEQGRAQGLLNGEPSTSYTVIRRQILADGDDSESIVYFGSSKPQVFGNLINSFSYGPLDFSINVSFKGDYYFLKPATSYSGLFGMGMAYPDFESRWQQSGDELLTDVPAMVYPVPSGSDAFYTQSELHVLKAAHVRLEYVNLAYNFLLNSASKNYRFRVYANASNLGLLWTENRENIDPEFPYTLRPPRTVSVGLQFDY